MLENCRSVCELPCSENHGDHANQRHIKYDERNGAEYNISTSYIISCVHDNISFEMVVDINRGTLPADCWSEPIYFNPSYFRPSFDFNYTLGYQSIHGFVTILH